MKGLAMALTDEEKRVRRKLYNKTALASKYKWTKANKDKVRASNRKHYAANKEKINAYGRDYNLDNKEKIQSKKKTYYKANVVKFTKRRHKRNSHIAANLCDEYVKKLLVLVFKGLFIKKIKIESVLNKKIENINQETGCVAV